MDFFIKLLELLFGKTKINKKTSLPTGVIVNYSEHFPKSELEFSQTAVRKGIDNTIPTEMDKPLTDLCVHVLEKIRVHYGKAVWISSGYRSPALNKKVGGTDNSQHMRGEAADIVISGIKPIEVCKWVMENVDDFDQVIEEGTWTHVSFAANNNRKKALKATFDSKGKASYSELKI